MMLGVYDYTVVLTYVSVLISMGGMLFSMNGYPRMAIVCLALSGFGVGPTLIAYRMGMNHGIGVTILMFYVLAGLIRLAWYNVSEEIRQEETTENRECYQGLPITSMAVALPILYVFRPILGKDLSLPCMRLY